MTYTSPSLDDIAVSLGRPTPTEGTLDAKQWLQLIGDAERQIRARLGDLDLLDPDNVQFVVREAVANRLRSRPMVQSVDVDDVAVRYFGATSMGVYVLTEWWDLLAPAARAGVGTFRPTYEPDYGDFPARVVGPYPIAGAVDVIPPQEWP